MKTFYKNILILSNCVLLLFHCGKSINDPSPDLAKGNGSGVGVGMVNGKLYKPDGITPAYGAIISLRYKDAIASINQGGIFKTIGAVHTTTTNEDGIFSFDSIDTGLYVVEGADEKENMILFDSIKIISMKIKIDLPPDTLEPPGAVKGSVLLINGGNPQQAFILAFGVDRFSQVKSDGTFLFAPFAAGTYKITILSLDPQYGSVDTGNIIVKSNDTVDIGAIELPFRKQPVPVVSLQYDTVFMKATLTWRPTPASITKGYNIYRVPVNASDKERDECFKNPINLDYPNYPPGLWKDTVYIDSFNCEMELESQIKRENIAFEYFVAMVDSTDNESRPSKGVGMAFVSKLEIYDSIQVPLDYPGYIGFTNDDGFVWFKEIEKSKKYEIDIFSNKGALEKTIPVPNLLNTEHFNILPINDPFDLSGNCFFLAYSELLGKDSSQDSVYLCKLDASGIFSDTTPLSIGSIYDGYYNHYTIIGNALYFSNDSGNIINKLDLQTYSLSIWKDFSLERHIIAGIMSDHNGGIVVRTYEPNSVPGLHHIFRYDLSGELLYTFPATNFPLENLVAVVDSFYLFNFGYCRLSSSGELLYRKTHFLSIGDTWVRSDKKIITPSLSEIGKMWIRRFHE